MENKEMGGAAFTAPSLKSGNAELPQNSGQVTKKSASKSANESSKKVARDIKVIAISKGWFDAKRIEPGMKLTVSASEFSDKWMEKI